jgi:hypothetical protein
MRNKSLVKLSNIIGIISIILLVYWVFIFISTTVFGLKVFKESITDTFFFSIMGILALMAGSLIINVMLNLTRIAEKHNKDDLNVSKQRNKKSGLIFALSFPLILALLFIGDYSTSKKKEKMLIASAKSIIEDNNEMADNILDYAFNRNWIKETADILNFYSDIDEDFPNVSVIVADTTTHETRIFLRFRAYYPNVVETDTIPAQLNKRDFILQTSKEERDYLNNVFYKNIDQIRFIANDGYYELFYPYFKNGKKIVLYFSDYQRYGKFGSY